MSIRVSCPGCGGSVVFTVGSSMVAVCPYCRSAVARGDRSVEDLGKVAALVETGAVLRVGTEGRYDGVKFHLTGRTQLGHEAGGVWDEWYAAFADDRWGWLAEAQGRFYLTFEEDAAELPAYHDLTVGEATRLPGGRQFTVAEAGKATVRGAEGEIPYRLTPGGWYLYADLSGPAGQFATLDYSEAPPTLYTGKQVTLDDLHVPDEVREAFQLAQVAGRRLGCPNCGGSLDLKAPDRTERVGCPYCGSLLDCDKGELRLLHALDKPAFKLDLPIGTRGKFGDAERTVIGALKRSVTFDGEDFFWYEYLLYHPRDGFEWLVCSDGHWSRVKGVEPGGIEFVRNSAVYQGKQFKKFAQATAAVRGVVGECYWKVAVGEQVDTTDYINPPLILSCEKTRTGKTDEVNWSFGTYLTPVEVEKAFDLKEPLPAPKGVGANQPFPWVGVYKLAALFLGLLLAVGLVLACLLPTRKVHEQTFQLQSNAVATPEGAGPAPGKTQVFFTDHFELNGHKNVRITVSYPNLHGWMAVECDLVQQATGEVQPVVIGMGKESGTDGDGAWSEGETVKSESVSAQPAGQYSLRLEVEREHPETGGLMSVKVEQGTATGVNWLLALVGIALIPVGVAIYHAVFTSKRWEGGGIQSFEPPRRRDDDAGESGPEPELPPIPLADPAAPPARAQRAKPPKLAKRPKGDSP